MAAAAGGALLCCSGVDPRVWFPGTLLLNLMDHTDIVRDLTFAPDGSLMLVSASTDKTLRVWDLKDDGTPPPPHV